MGSFAYYTGCMTIPEEKKPVFVEQMCRLLYLGGMMTTEEVKMFGNTLTLFLASGSRRHRSGGLAVYSRRDERPVGRKRGEGHLSV